MGRRTQLYAQPDIASSLNNLAVLYKSKGEYDKALPLYFEALEMRRRTLPEAHPDIASSLNNLAVLYKSNGEDDNCHCITSYIPRHQDESP